MSSPSHLFNVSAIQPQKNYTSGTRTDVNVANFPVLKGMALSILNLLPKGVREPHWHPNAHELSYCIEGKGLMTIFNPENGHETFIIEPGTLAFVPMGSMHHIENLGDTLLQMLVCFNHETPENLNLSTSLQVMPDSLLAATFKMDPHFFAELKKTQIDGFIFEKSSPTETNLSWMTNRFKSSTAMILPQLENKGGFVKMTKASMMSTLKGLTLYYLNLEPGGAREPHWHPNAHELNYLIKGQARIVLLSPNGHVEQLEMTPGHMSFLPRGYLHSIECIGEEPAEFAIFFNHESPSDIGLSGCLGAYSNDLLTALLNLKPNSLDSLPKYQEDLLIVTSK